MASTSQPPERFLKMLWDYLRFDFGNSYFRDRPVISLILEKMPVSISLGLWLTLVSYLISIPLGIRKAVKDGSTFDIWTSAVIIVGYAIPNFIFAIILIVLFAGGSYWDWFPLRGLTSDNFDQLSLWGKIKDYIWHMTLPLLALGISSFATMTLLTKNSFLDEIKKQYVTTARAKGLTENRVLYGHVLPQRHAAGHRRFPRCFFGVVFLRLPADRAGVLSGWLGLAHVHVGGKARLCRGVCKSLYHDVARLSSSPWSVT